VSDNVSFLDTSVLLRHYLDDHEEHSPRAKRLIGAIRRGERSVQISDTVVFEAVYVLDKLYRVPRETISELLQEFLDFSCVLLPGKRNYHQVFINFVDFPGLSIADCFHVEIAKLHAAGSIISFDRSMERVVGVVREEP